MAYVKEIEKAILAHGIWKMRLTTGLYSGEFDIPVTTIQVDNECPFGKWLYSQTLTASDKSTPDYETVRDLHTQFHKVAGKVAELAIAGKKVDGEKLLSGDFTIASEKLTAAMLAWAKISR